MRRLASRTLHCSRSCRLTVIALAFYISFTLNDNPVAFRQDCPKVDGLDSPHRVPAKLPQSERGGDQVDYEFFRRSRNAKLLRVYSTRFQVIL